MLQNSKDIVCRLELVPEVKFTYMSPSVEDILGYPLEDYLKNPMLPFEIVHPEDHETQMSKINGNTDFSKMFQLRYKHKDGYYVWLEDYVIPTFNENGELIAAESITRNIQERKYLEQMLKKIGYYDNLTGLFNKNYLLKEMNLLNNKINMPIEISIGLAYSETSINTIESTFNIADSNMYRNKREKKRNKHVNL